ncbi:hypothetical protein [Vibrio phage phiKT1028]|nr:hypothetical protein [Vibrio phage phiKT1028]
MPEMDGMSDVLNDFKSNTLGRMSEVYQTKTENFKLSDLKDLADIEGGKIKLNKDKMLGELSDVLGYNITDKDAFFGQAGDELFELFTQLTDPDGGALLDKNGDQLSFKDGWREGTTEGLIYSLARSGVELYNEVKDSAMQDAYDATVLYSAARAGMVEAYAPIHEKIKPKEKADSMMINALKYVIGNGDYFSFREMLRILGIEHYPKIRSTYPTLPITLLAAYYLDKSVYQHEHEALCLELDGHLSTIYGTEWYLTDTAHGKAYNALIGSGLSDDAVTLLMNVDRLSVLVSLRNTFDEMMASEVFFSQFPETPEIKL